MGSLFSLPISRGLIPSISYVNPWGMSRITCLYCPHCNRIRPASFIFTRFEERTYQNLRVDQTVPRAALDTNNIIGLRQLLNFPFRSNQLEIDLRSPISISGRHLAPCLRLLEYQLHPYNPFHPTYPSAEVPTSTSRQQQLLDKYI
jgi:hypothetical protein